jgi:hypothetical protein
MSDWIDHIVDGGLLRFDRRTGLNTLRRGPSTTANRRVAPRVFQVGLLTPCNLKCSFCYRDTHAPSRLTAPFLLDLLQRAADWGVVEVAFGGGEPFLFQGFAGLVRELHRRTRLGINVTTNGTLLTDDVLDELGDACGEIRLSAYSDNHYRRTLKLLAGRQVGVNWLVTPNNVGLVEPTVRDFFSLGARNVLLLGYKGADASLRLAPDDLARFRQSVMRMQHMPLRLDICWYPLLADLPQLFARHDCGAGDEFLVITPDRAVQPCSFHHERIPFETFDELRSIYAELRERRPLAKIGGCTRERFVAPSRDQEPAREELWAWHARAANNSGDWTIVGRFNDPADARRVADELRALARQHEAYLASDIGQAFLESNEFNGSIPTPPLRAFGVRHGFEWPDIGGLWWEEDGFGAPVLTAGAVGDAVVVYHPYCMGLPEDAFRTLFARNGAREFGYWQYDRPAVLVTASGRDELAVKLVEQYLSRLATFKYAHELKEPPPWGATASDPRLEEDEDRNARLETGEHSIQQDATTLRLRLVFENTFAGSVAIHQWLTSCGYRDIDARIDDVLSELARDA